MPDKLNILILHRMGDPRTWRESVAELALALPRYAPEHNYLVHNAVVPLPLYAQEFEFDAIILNSTFLSSVFSPKLLHAIKKNYEFLKTVNSFKIALPQDDYYCSEERDALMVEWKVDLVHTVCPSHWDILYPKFIAQGGRIELGYTGYITPSMRQRALSPKSRRERLYDVVYRASGKPSFPNKLATVKAEIGNIFQRNFSDQNWNMNISNSESKAIHGSMWWDFLESSRCVLGANSGSSNLIRNHEISKNIRKYITNNPLAKDDEILAACLPDQDRNINFTAISPRVLEAALLNTVQILIPGEYSGILQPWVDYIPLKEDCSNKEDIINIVNNFPIQSELASSCKAKIMSYKAIQVESFILNIISNIRNHSQNHHFSQKSLNSIKNVYENEVRYKFTRYCFFQRSKLVAKKHLPKCLLDRLKKIKYTFF